LTDLGMPAMNGWEVAKWVKHKVPESLWALSPDGNAIG